VNEGSVALRLPASASWLSIARLFVASSCWLLELDSEAVEDVKLVVTELCSAALESAAEAEGTLTVEVRWAGDRATVVVRGTAVTFAAVSDGDARAQMLEALVPDLQMLDDGRAVEFSLVGARSHQAAPKG
jgi:anti-sigma regulatory factor (Ser/Thr protein kinase)